MRFQLLGEVRFEAGGEPVGLGRRQERCLLGLLLLETRRVVPIDRLADLLWHGSPPLSGRAAIHTYTARLRRLLRPHGLTVETRGGGYLMDVPPELVDVHLFTAALAEAQRTPAPQARLSKLEEAVAYWRGPLLADVADDLLRERVGSGLEDLRFTALELRAQSLLDTGRQHEAVSLLKTLAAAHPAREGLAGLLMRALYDTGRQAEALATYRTTRELLATDLGLEPSPALRELHHRMLLGDVAPPEPAAQPSPRRYLPRAVPDFTGRESELSWLDGAVAGPSAVAVISAVAGAGGVGKTALAVHWGQQSASRFPDGQFYLDLRGYGSGVPLSSAEALHQLLLMAGVRADALPAGAEEAAAMFRRVLAGQRVLVILDNARSAEQVRPLLPGSPEAAVVVTSRDRLGGLVVREGARRIDLGTLSRADAAGLLGTLLGPGRAGAQAGVLAGLAEACGRFPLALRIAAANLAEDARATVQSYTASLARDGRVGALRVDGDPASAVEAVFGLSLAWLSPAGLLLFRRIGLLPVASLRDWVATALLGGEAAGGLAELVEASLITATRENQYAVHDLVQEYAAGLSTPDDQAALRRCYETLLGLAVAADRQLASRHFPVPDAPLDTELPADPLVWLAAEQSFVAAAAVDSAARGWTELACDLLSAVANFAGNPDYIGTWTEAAEHVLGAAGAGAPGRGPLLLALGGLRRARGHNTTALPMLREARRVLARTGQVLLAGVAATQLGMAYRMTRQVRAASAASAWAIGHLRGYPESAQLGWAHLARGTLRHEITPGDEQACNDHEEALAIFRRTGDRAGEANALSRIAQSLNRAGRHREAAARFEESCQVLAGFGEPVFGSVTGCHLARTWLKVGDIAAAWRSASDALALARSADDARALRDALSLAGEIALSRSDPPTALAMFTEAAGLARTLQPPTFLPRILQYLARAHAGLGDFEAAALTGREAAARYAEADMLDQHEEVNRWLSTLDA
ncbi:AfsR/SARP family transcriptional regulator [Longispora albida]|uniref:AfsR/SARP family transcriptional regulator n=1 Tax=Longispora albida TaxID=203523 RepID=UPI00036EA3E7|nr:BTAD domain-containing putative transcriptional regulator [Longispora albida]